jgi:CRP/FNR family transcriptional regulator, anaerobic regulatory protein
MTQALIDYIQQYVKFNEEELRLIRSFFQPQRCSKNSLLEKEDYVAKHLYFIVEGFVRVSFVEDGNEITTHIRGKNNFITAFDSFLNGGRSAVNIQCITNCTVLSLAKENYKQLHLRSLSWRTFCKTIYEKELQAPINELSTYWH